MPQKKREITQQDENFIMMNIDTMPQYEMAAKLHISTERLNDIVEDLRERGFTFGSFKRHNMDKKFTQQPLGNFKEYPYPKDIRLEKLRAAAARIS